MAVASIGEALALRDTIASAQTCTLVDGPAGDWVLTNGEIRNTRADFFRIVGKRTAYGDQLLIRQTEPALVGLVVTGPPGERAVLLNARAEPGLHEGCQFSTTIQSTPANYLRRHGGASTPFLSDVLDAPAHRVVYEGLQFDWGQYYDAKVKRFRIVEVDGQVAVDAPLVWVSQNVVGELCGADFAGTSDLRAAFAALEWMDRGARPADRSLVPEVDQSGRVAERDVPLHDGRAWVIEPRGIRMRDGSREVIWVATESLSREVKKWTQPLVRLAQPLESTLALRYLSGVLEAAVVWASREGLGGRSLLYPGACSGGNVVSRATLSAEGGRFWQHPVHLRVVMDAEVDDASWHSVADLVEQALAPMRTSVELRLLLGLVASKPRTEYA